MSGIIGAVWGITGVLLLLASAVYRLAPIAATAFSVPFAWYHWLSLVLCILIMAHAEGYRGFQLHFSPRVAARARYLREHPKPLRLVLAPLFCMGYFHATRRRRVVSFSLTAGIILLIVVVHNISQPWRGIIDAGVVTGLAWGIISLIWFSYRAFSNRGFVYSPEVPETVMQKNPKRASNHE